MQVWEKKLGQSCSRRMSVSCLGMCLFVCLLVASCVSPVPKPSGAFGTCFLVLDTFEDCGEPMSLPGGWEVSTGFPGFLSCQDGKDSCGRALLIDGRKGSLALRRFFEPQTGVFTVELDMAPASSPHGLLALYLGGNVWVESFSKWSVCLSYDLDSATAAAGPFRWFGNDWQQTAVKPETSRWYHVRYVVDVPNQCFDLWLDGERVASECPFRSPASEVSCLMVNVKGRAKKPADAVLIDNVTMYPGKVRPAEGTPVLAGVVPKSPPNAFARAAADAPAAKPGYELTFQDEFNGNAIDTTVWNYGRTPKDGVGEAGLINEFHPCVVKDGIAGLRIQKRAKAHHLSETTMARYSKDALKTYTAPGIATWGGKFSQAYGWWEIRCKMPRAYGIWTGFWLLPVKKRGVGAAEIDIFEHLTRWHDKISFALHPHWKEGEEFGHAGLQVSGLADDFHVYALDWRPDRLTLYVDGVQVDEYTGKGVPSAASYIIVSCRTGGWAGKFVDEASLPDDFEIDYVRIYKRNQPEGR